MIKVVLAVLAVRCIWSILGMVSSIWKAASYEETDPRMLRYYNDGLANNIIFWITFIGFWILYVITN